MSDISSLAQEYVTREVFDAERRLNNERFTSLLTLMEKNFELTNEKIEHVTDTLTVAINDTNKRIYDTNKRIDDMHQTMSSWFMLFGVLVVVVPIAVKVIEAFVRK